MNVYFSGGKNGKREAGLYKFWVLVGEKHEFLETASGRPFRHAEVIRTKSTFWARFNKANPAWKKRMREVVVQIRRARAYDVQSWLNTHPEDAVFAEWP